MKIVIAEQDGIDAFGAQADEFLRDILGHEEAFITDRSGIGDFIEFSIRGAAYAAAKKEIWKKIETKYVVDCTGEISILAILRKVHAPKGHA